MNLNTADLAFDQKTAIHPKPWTVWIKMGVRSSIAATCSVSELFAYRICSLHVEQLPQQNAACKKHAGCKPWTYRSRE